MFVYIEKTGSFGLIKTNKNRMNYLFSSEFILLYLHKDLIYHLSKREKSRIYPKIDLKSDELYDIIKLSNRKGSKSVPDK